MGSFLRHFSAMSVNLVPWRRVHGQRVSYVNYMARLSSPWHQVGLHPPQKRDALKIDEVV